MAYRVSECQQRGRCRNLAAVAPGASGFTLIEVMIVIAIVGLLAAVAYPAYQDHLRKGNRAAAQAFMMEVAQRQQSYRMNNRSYALTLETLGLALPDDVAPFYTVAGTELGVISGPPQTFNLRLDPASGSVQVGDGSLCLTSAGARTRNCQSDATAEAW